MFSGNFHILTDPLQKSEKYLKFRILLNQFGIMVEDLGGMQPHKIFDVVNKAKTYYFTLPHF